ncbi:MAG: hypothetical protein LBJ11_07005 [Oscillospiraceae bacterium]|nr:hypothetical protein [Oscillospiraceae bacterium]
MGIFNSSNSRGQEPMHYTVSFRFVEDGSPGSTFHRMPATAGSTIRDYPADSHPVREGWDFVRHSPPELMRVEQNEVVDVHYVRSVHTVTFTDENGRHLSLPGAVQRVRHGEDAEPPAYIPPAGFILTGWDGGWRRVTEDRSIRAKAVPRSYSVIFLDREGKYIGKPRQVESGGQVDPPRVWDGAEETAPAEGETAYRLPEGFRFLGWSRTTQAVTEDVISVALVEKIPAAPVSHTITFLDENGSELERREVLRGGPAAPPAYTVEFQGVTWPGADEPVTEDRTIRCILVPKYCEVTFFSPLDGGVIEAQRVVCGQDAVPPAPEAVAGLLPPDHEFLGWYRNLQCVTADMWVPANIRKITYHNVTFLDETGAPLGAPQRVRDREDAVPPAYLPLQGEGWRHTGWSDALACVTEDRTIQAEVERKAYFVTFLDETGEELGRTQVFFGDDAAPPAGLPALPAGCKARRWTGDLADVREDRTLTEELEWETCYVVFYDKDGYELDELVVEYGRPAVPPAYDPPEGWEFCRWQTAGEAESGETLPGALDRITADTKVYAQCVAHEYGVIVLDLRPTTRPPKSYRLGKRPHGARLTLSDLLDLRMDPPALKQDFTILVTQDIILAVMENGIKVFDHEMGELAAYRVGPAQTAVGYLAPMPVPVDDVPLNDEDPVDLLANA